MQLLNFTLMYTVNCINCLFYYFKIPQKAINLLKGETLFWL